MPFLLVNKPAGPTSHDIINQLRRITGIKKIGHAGTLDPFAEGLLLVAIGRESTREISQFVGLDKKYLATLKLGAVSDTQDKTGKIVICNSESYPLLNKEGQGEVNSAIAAYNHIRLSASRPPLFLPLVKGEITKVLQNFIGPQEQIPPMFSAKKIKGKKLYELARAGKEIARQPHRIIIHNIKLIKYLPEKNELILEIDCSSGTYIRALADDIGQALGCGAYLGKLVRLQIGDYKLENAISPEKLTKENWQEFGFEK